MNEPVNLLKKLYDNNISYYVEQKQNNNYIKMLKNRIDAITKIKF